jgi:hypothetical protein
VESCLASANLIQDVGHLTCHKPIAGDSPIYRPLFFEEPYQGPLVQEVLRAQETRYVHIRA